MAREPDLLATPAPAFTAVARHYDVVMRDVPYRGWVRYLDVLLRRRDVSPHCVLDLACGTGNVSELLARRGWGVVGVDISADMIAVARAKAERRGLPIAYHVQDAAAFDLGELRFDLCVSLFDSLNYVTDPAALAAALRRAIAHLRPGGLFIFDVNSAFALENGFFDQTNQETGERVRYVWRSEFDPDTRLCRVQMRFFVRNRTGVDEEFREVHVQRAYREEELRAMLADAGFVGVESFHAYTTRPVTSTSDRIFFVASRPD